MKPIALFLIIFLNISRSYSQNCSYENIKLEESSDALVTNLTLLLYKSLPIYTINMGESIFNTHGKIIAKNKKSPTTYNYFLNESEERSLWTPLLGIAHRFGHSISMNKVWFNHLLQPCDKDLKIDYLSGYILAKMGASVQDCEETFRAISNQELFTKNNNTRRLNALIAGHFRARYNF